MAKRLRRRILVAPVRKPWNLSAIRTRAWASLSRIMMAGLFVGLGACTRPMEQCSPGMGPPVLVFTLFFGQSVAGRGDVTDIEWRGFLDDTVTPNLPNGYTVIEANGAWMNPITHTTIKEPTKVLLAALPFATGSLAIVNRIRTDYQIRFHQQLVGMTTGPACGAF